MGTCGALYLPLWTGAGFAIYRLCDWMWADGSDDAAAQYAVYGDFTDEYRARKARKSDVAD